MKTQTFATLDGPQGAGSGPKPSAVSGLSVKISALSVLQNCQRTPRECSPGVWACFSPQTYSPEF